MPEDREGEGAEVPDDSKAGTPNRRRRRVLTAVGAAFGLAIISTTAILGWLWKSQRDRDSAAQEGLAAAQRFVSILTDIDVDQLDQNIASVVAGSTGDFKDKYAQSSAQLRQLLVDNKAAAHGVVVESAVKSASPEQVEVLLFVDQSVSNAASPEPRLDRSRIRMTVDNVDGRWLVSKVELP